MEWGFFPFLARLLAERGFCAVRFNFSGSGMQPGDELVTDPEAFRGATFSQDLRELRAILGAVGKSIAADCANPHRIALVGHSRGAGTALLAAADENSSIKALITWAAVSSFDRLSARERDGWRQSGELEVVNTRTGQALTIGPDVLTDLETHASELDLFAAARRRSAPWLIVHGRDDETVSFSEAEHLRAVASEPTDLCPIEGGDHTFGARHPFVGPTVPLTAAMNATQIWLRRYLSPSGPSESD